MTHSFHPTSLREYDIRGLVGDTLTGADARAIGRSFGTIIARAGGFTDRASKSKIRVKRRAADGKETELVYDYKRIVDGKERDPEILADDVIIVKEYFF